MQTFKILWSVHIDFVYYKLEGAKMWNVRLDFIYDEKINVYGVKFQINGNWFLHETVKNSLFWTLKQHSLQEVKLVATKTTI